MALPGTFATEIILEFCCLGKCPDSRKKVPKMGFPFLTLTLGDTRISSSLTPGIVYVPVDTYWCPRHTCVLLLYSWSDKYLYRPCELEDSCYSIVYFIIMTGRLPAVIVRDWRFWTAGRFQLELIKDDAMEDPEFWVGRFPILQVGFQCYKGVSNVTRGFPK